MTAMPIWYTERNLKKIVSCSKFFYVGNVYIFFLIQSIYLCMYISFMYVYLYINIYVITGI